jgi:hypothetical protein
MLSFYVDTLKCLGADTVRTQSLYMFILMLPLDHTTVNAAAMLSGMRHSDLDDLLLLNTVPHSLGVSAVHQTVTL